MILEGRKAGEDIYFGGTAYSKMSEYAAKYDLVICNLRYKSAEEAGIRRTFEKSGISVWNPMIKRLYDEKTC